VARGSFWMMNANPSAPSFEMRNVNVVVNPPDTATGVV